MQLLLCLVEQRAAAPLDQRQVRLGAPLVLVVLQYHRRHVQRRQHVAEARREAGAAANAAKEAIEAALATALEGVATLDEDRILRGFSAPVVLDIDYSDAQLLTLLAHDAELVAQMMPTLQRVTTVNSLTPQTVAEDFSESSTRVPGIFMFLGNGDPAIDPATLPSNHSPLFDMYEPSLEIGVRVFSNLVVDYLQSP